MVNFGISCIFIWNIPPLACAPSVHVDLYFVDGFALPIFPCTTRWNRDGVR